MNLEEVLDAADAEPKETKTVRVCLIPSVAKKRAALLNALETARERDAKTSTDDARLGAPATKSTAATDAAAAELEQFDAREDVQSALVTFRFTAVDGEKWAYLTSTNPMRLDVHLDRLYGYNFHAVTIAAAKLTGVHLTDEGEQKPTDEVWDRLLAKLTGHDFNALANAVWELNEWEPQQRVAALVKGSGVA